MVESAYNVPSAIHGAKEMCHNREKNIFNLPNLVSLHDYLPQQCDHAGTKLATATAITINNNNNFTCITY